MSWKNNIPVVFGVTDKLFGQHSLEISRARMLLVQAGEEGVGFQDYLDAIEAWLRSQKLNPAHIESEMSKVKDLSNYFDHD